MLAFLALAVLACAQAQMNDPAALALSLNLTSTFNYNYPLASSIKQYSDTSTRAGSSYTKGNNATINYMRANWNLERNNVQFGRQDLSFVQDPESSKKLLVLAARYPAGSYSHATGGAQFYSAFPNITKPPQAMLLTYSVYFPKNYDFVKGGKLAGLRGGQVEGCAGGEKTDGTTCFSARLMWREGGAGEVYAYLPEINGLCQLPNVICDPTYGTSLGRGQFTFQPGAWNDLALYIRLNDPSKANGIVQLWHNGQKSIDFTNLVLRTSTAISSVGGQMFSTFFGGSDQTWSTPKTQYTYYRQMAMYAGSGGQVGAQSGPQSAVVSGQASTTAVIANAATSTASTTSSTSSSSSVPGPTNGVLPTARLNGLAGLVAVAVCLALLV